MTSRDGVDIGLRRGDVGRPLDSLRGCTMSVWA